MWVGGYSTTVQQSCPSGEGHGSSSDGASGAEEFFSLKVSLTLAVEQRYFFLLGVFCL